MGNLSSHRKSEEQQEVDQQDGPKDGNIEGLEEGSQKGIDGARGGIIPELEFGKTADEGAEFVISTGGKDGRTKAMFVIFVLHTGHEARCQEQ